LLFISNSYLAESSKLLHSYPIPSNGNLELKTSDSWMSGYNKVRGVLPPTINYLN